MKFSVKKGLILATAGVMLGCSNVAPPQAEVVNQDVRAPLTAPGPNTAPGEASSDEKTYTTQQFGRYSRHALYRCLRRCRYLYPSYPGIYPSRYNYRYRICVRNCYRRFGYPRPWGGGYAGGGYRGPDRGGDDEGDYGGGED